MSNATGPRPTRPTPPNRRHLLRIWRCGLCNTECKTVLAPGGLCSLCRRAPALPGVDDLHSIGGER